MVSGKAYMTKYDFLTSYGIILGIIPFHLLLFLFTPLLVCLFFVLLLNYYSYRRNTGWCIYSLRSRSCLISLCIYVVVYSSASAAIVKYLHSPVLFIQGRSLKQIKQESI